jgi:hypothetical protein
MKKLLFFICLILLCGASYSQGDSGIFSNHRDTVKQYHQQGSLVNVIVAEALIIGASYLAAEPKAYGDKMVGWMYAGGSAALLVYIPFYLTNKGNNSDPDFKKHRTWNTVTMLGLSYGFSRVATYNLIHGKGDPFNTRLKRNLIEIHAAYIVPIFAGGLLGKYVLKNKPTTKVKTNLQFDGSNVYLTMRF